MKTSGFLSLLSILFVLPVMAQEDDNLVPNPSFEQVTGKVRRLGGIEYVNDWSSPTGAQADIFVSKMDGEDPGTPNNVYGKEDPADGGNYAGFIAFSYNDKEDRTYLTAKLNEPLRKGLKYCVKFKISLAEASSYASNNIAANFSKRKFNYDEPRTIIDEMHIHDVDNRIFNARFNWDEICGTYTAEGGEKFITIGNFKSNGETENERMRKDPKMRIRQIYSAYYYVDDVSVRIVENRTECDCNSGNKVMGSDLIYSSTKVHHDDMTDEEYVEQTNLYFAYGKDKLEVAAEKELDSLALMMKNNPTYRLKIIGHQDELETEGAKTDGALRGLSTKRATAVFFYLKNKGVSDDRLEKTDVGDFKPADKLDNKIAHAKNRRVEFELIK